MKYIDIDFRIKEILICHHHSNRPKDFISIENFVYIYIDICVWDSTWKYFPTEYVEVAYNKDPRIIHAMI